MSPDAEIDRALATVNAAINGCGLDSFDRHRVQEIVDSALGSRHSLTVDDGGGLHMPSGARVGAIRRTGSGEWIIERQNPAGAGSDAEVPSPAPQGKVRKLVTKLKPGS